MVDEIAMITAEKIIEAKDLPLEEWLHLVTSPDPGLVFPPKCFPTDEHRDAFFDTVRDRSEEDVKALLRYFLIRSGNYQCDEFHFAFLAHTAKTDLPRFKYLMSFEHNGRLLSKEPTWQGNTWVLDLLPHWPKTAIDALWAYFLAHAQLLPDFWLHGQSDAISLIRARYIEYVHPRDIFFELTPRQFECLIKSLYDKMGYETELTPAGNDGGRDIIAKCNESGRKETIYIECKRWESKVGRPVLQRLFGTVQAHHSSRGILVCSSDFTGPAKMFADNLAPLELINADALIELLNQHLGTKWPQNLERHAKEDDLRQIHNA